MATTPVDRRAFLRAGTGFSAAVGAIALAGRGLRAQAPAAPARRPNRYEENVRFEERKAFSWPGGATVAVWIIPNVEVFQFDIVPGSPQTPGPDVPGYSWREYGMRVGLWRLADAMDTAGIRGTVALNAGVCDVFPRAIEELDKRGWEMMGHNVTNSQSLRNLPPEKEHAIIDTTLKVIQQATGKPVRGWLGSGLAETFDTLDVLAAGGVRYTGDWNNDDLPVLMKVKSGEMHGLPYGNEINDIRFFGSGHTGEEYLQMVKDQFDRLYADSKTIPRVMGIPLHPFHVGQPLRIKYFAQAIAHIKQHERVWFATGSEILEAYKKAQA